MKILKEILQNAIVWAKEAGEIQLKAFRSSSLDIQTKSNVHDVVTRIDKECEQLLINRIHSKYPDHSIMGEETGNHQASSDWQWIVDPLDGTNNYSQGLPIFTVSIGVEYKGETKVGVVFAPYLNELYTAVEGEGAFLNGKQIHVSEKNELCRSVLATGFPYDKDINPDNNVDNVSRIVPLVRGLRRNGSAAYDLCLVAAGFLDGYWEFNLHIWDVCAAQLIVKEAGGKIEPFRENRGIAIIAANSSLLVKIRENLYLSAPETI